MRPSDAAREVVTEISCRGALERLPGLIERATICRESDVLGDRERATRASMLMSPLSSHPDRFPSANMRQELVEAHGQVFGESSRCIGLAHLDRIAPSQGDLWSLKDLL